MVRLGGRGTLDSGFGHATILLCDHEQVMALLWASLSSSEKVSLCAEDGWVPLRFKSL